MAHSNPADDTTLAARLGYATLETLAQAEVVVQQLINHGLCITAVESCTGGSFVNILTSISGSSGVVKQSFVTYSNEAKIQLGVAAALIDEYTVYSLETAVAMARAGLQRALRVDISVGITGSLTRTDPTNDNSIPGEVYIAVVWQTRTAQRKLYITEPHRALAKLEIVNQVLQTIQVMLDEYITPAAPAE